MRGINPFWKFVLPVMAALLWAAAGTGLAAEVYRLPFAGTSQPTIVNAIQGDLEGNLRTIEQADLNNDGALELIAGGGTLFAYDVKNETYLWGTGGTAGEPSGIITDIAVGEFTGDDIPDVVTVDICPTSPSQGLCLWDGSDGTLVRTWEITADTRRNADHAEVLAVADLDEDGDLDIVTGGYLGTIGATTYNTDAVAAFDGNTGALLWHFACAGPVTAVAAGDTTGNGSREVAVAENNNVRCFNGASGAEVFTGTTIEGGSLIDDLVLADLDQDGDLDIAAGTNHYIEAFADNGSRMWLFDDLVGDGDFWHDLAVADYNQDGAPDIAAVNYDGDGWAVVNGSDGTLLNSGGFDNHGLMTAAGDLNQDGLPALVWGDDSAYTGAVDPVTGGLLWQHDNMYASVYDLALGDFTGDGFSQVAGIPKDQDFAYLLDGRTPASLWAVTGEPLAYDGSSTASRFVDVAAADLNEDGRADLIVLDSMLARVAALDGTTGRPLWTHEFTGTWIPHILATGDADGDGRVDIAAFGTSELYLLDADGAMLEAAPRDTGYNFDHFLVADLDDDGVDELILGDIEGLVIFGNMSAFASTVDIDFRHNGYDRQHEAGLAFGQVDTADPEGDLLALGYDTGTSEYRVYEIKTADPGIGSATTVVASTTKAWKTIALAQIDDDSQLEIVLGRVNGFDVYDAVEASWEYTFNSTAYTWDNYLRAADLDEDGYDEIVAGGESKIIAMQLDSGDWTGDNIWSREFSGISTEDTQYYNDKSEALCDLLVEDLDGDGDLDVAAAFRFGNNLRLLDGATGDDLEDAILLNGDNGSINATVQLAAADVSARPGTEIAASVTHAAGIFSAPTTADYDATGTWDLTITAEDSDCGYNIGDTTLTVEQTGTSVSVQITEGPLLTGTVSGATYTVSGQIIDDEAPATYYVTITLDDADTGSGTVAWMEMADVGVIACTGEAGFDVVKTADDPTTPTSGGGGGGGGGGGCYIHTIF